MNYYPKKTKNKIQGTSEEYLIGCDVTPFSSLTAYEVLSAYKNLTESYPESICYAKKINNIFDSTNKLFLLTEKRDYNTSFNAWNYIEKNNLQNIINYISYYYRNPFHNPRNSCRIWIEKNIQRNKLDSAALLKSIQNSKGEKIVIGNSTNRVLFFTPIHPLRKEGNSVHMRMWLDSLQSEGIVTDIVFYDYSLNLADQRLLEKTSNYYPNFFYLPRKSNLVSFNEEGLNIHLDDWCGLEVIELIQKLFDQYDYKAVIVNYVGFSKIFEVAPKTTKKVLITHDKFADRNRRLSEDGYSYCRWLSVTQADEILACERADYVVAIQENEKVYFESCVEETQKVVLIPQIFERRHINNKGFTGLFKIGYFGSPNDINMTNLSIFLKEIKNYPQLYNCIEIVLAGGVSEAFDFHIDKDLIDGLRIKKLGQIENIIDLFNECDLVINPERGGTGLKIKTIEALSYGMPILSTSAGFVGIESDCPYHIAGGILELAELCNEVYENQELLIDLKKASIETYDQFYSRHSNSLSELIYELTDRKDIIMPNNKHLSTEHNQVYRKSKTGLNRPKVSVIIPFYNVEDYIEECIKSVINQTYNNLEVIFVDDCSADGSRSIVEKYVSSNPEMKVLTHVQNLGLGPARNTGAYNAAGEHLIFLDSDDYFKENCVEILVEIAQREDVPIVIGSSDRLLPSGIVSEYDRLYDRGNKQAFGSISGEVAFKRAFNLPDTYYLPLRAWGTLHDRVKYLKSNLYFISTDHEDMGAIPFHYYFSRKVFYTDKVVCIYRIRDLSASTKTWDTVKTSKYIALWNIIKKNAEQQGLEKYIGNIALSQIYHLLHRIENHGLDPDSQDKLVEYFNQVSLALDPSLINKQLFYETMSYMQRVLFSIFPEKNDYLMFTKNINSALMQSYYKNVINA